MATPSFPEQTQGPSIDEGIAKSSKETPLPRLDAIEEPVPLVSQKGVFLIPRPSNDPRDPLNWPRWRKWTSVGVLSLAAFAGLTSVAAGQLLVGPLAQLYRVPTTSIAWQNSACQAAIIIGTFVLYSLSRVVGRLSVMFWSVIITLASQVWTATLTQNHQFNDYILSRAFSGFFALTVGVIGPRALTDQFFLHQRGRAFTVFHFSFDLGIAAGPSLCAFVGAAAGDWPWAFWWTAILLAVCAALMFFLLNDTTWDRSVEVQDRRAPEGYWSSRVATFLPGTQITPRLTWSEWFTVSPIPMKIALTPVTIVMGIFAALNFGMSIGINAITPVWLQRPEHAGGYAFTPMQNALFQFSHWLGILIALVYGQLLTDRLPLWIAGRFGKGDWKPEYRLHALWLPSLICMPLGMGVFGYFLAQHMNWGYLAFAHALVTFAALLMTPVSINYTCECFTKNVEETAIAMTAYRLLFGLSIPFYIAPWVDRVGFAWAYGMMAFILVLAYLFVVLLMWKGHEIRQWDPWGLISTEAGERVINNPQDQTQGEVP